MLSLQSKTVLRLVLKVNPYDQHIFFQTPEYLRDISESLWSSAVPELAYDVPRSGIQV